MGQCGPALPWGTPVWGGLVGARGTETGGCAVTCLPRIPTIPGLALFSQLLGAPSHLSSGIQAV